MTSLFSVSISLVLVVARIRERIKDVSDPWRFLKCIKIKSCVILLIMWHWTGQFWTGQFFATPWGFTLNFCYFYPQGLLTLTALSVWVWFENASCVYVCISSFSLCINMYMFLVCACTGFCILLFRLSAYFVLRVFWCHIRLRTFVSINPYYVRLDMILQMCPHATVGVSCQV